ncbi:MAG: glutathione-regulated potassium-efflux system protein KefB [Bdellovibrionaceae bacterium]|nr:glutathione-regulated potassium-efflux system protein KefB [Pseudobdellovibrionaceae bacterium]
MDQFLLTTTVFLGAAISFVPLFKRFGLGSILGYLFAGVLIGPAVLGLVEDVDTILHISELGVVMLLFVIGLELNPKRLWRMRRHVFGMGAAQVLVCGFLLAVLFFVLHESVNVAVLLGMTLALSSTAFALQLLEEKKQLQTEHGQGAFSILLFQDLAVVPLLALVPLLGVESGATSGAPTWIVVIKAVGVIAGLLVVGRYGVQHVFRFIALHGSHEVFTAAALFLVMGTAALVHAVGLSMALGAFLAGMLLASSEYRHELEASLSPFKGLLLGLFFMAVGMSLNLTSIIESPAYIVGVVIALVAIKLLAIFFMGRVFGYQKESARNMSVVISQGGEFGFVLLSVGVVSQVIDQNLSSKIAAVITLSMALTPLLVYLNQKFFRTFSELSERPEEVFPADEVQVLVVGYGRFGQIISRLLAFNQIPFIALDHSATQIELSKKFGTKVYYGDATRAEVLHAAGADKVKVIALAIDDVDDSIAATKIIRQKFSEAKLVARARNRFHAMELMALGVEVIHRETYESSLCAAADTLGALGLSKQHIDFQISTFREHDNKMLRDQLQYRHNEDKFISFTQNANKNLKYLLQGDQQFGKDPDQAN